MTYRINLVYDIKDIDSGEVMGVETEHETFNSLKQAKERYDVLCDEVGHYIEPCKDNENRCLVLYRISLYKISKNNKATLVDFFKE